MIFGFEGIFDLRYSSLSWNFLCAIIPLLDELIMTNRWILVLFSALLAGCGSPNDVQSGEPNATTTIPGSASTRKSVRYQGTRNPRNSPLSGEVVQLISVENSFSGFSALHVSDPGTDSLRATVIYFHARNGNGHLETKLLLNKGLLGDLAKQTRFVAPQFSNSAWFPYVNLPGGSGSDSLARKEDIDRTLSLIAPLIDHEASLLGGDYSRIFLYGFSQGAMMAIWAGLMLDRPFGGVVNFAGCLPVFDINSIPENSRRVPIFHIHDPLDTAVKFKFAKSGYDSAINAGARMYEPIFESFVGGKMHHSLSFEAIMITSDWLEERL
jgi:predicted esterase